MFTGLIEAVGTVTAVSPQDDGARLGVDIGGLRETPAPGASVAVDGCCLTVTSVEGNVAAFDAVSETMRRSTLHRLRPGDRVNLESSLRVGDPLDGHIVLGHVDGTGELLREETLPESRVWHVSLPTDLAPLVVAKGSVAVAGVSLTVVEAGSGSFSVSLIPETLARTTLGGMRPGRRLNLEADVLARYVAGRLSADGGGLTVERLRDLGFA